MVFIVILVPDLLEDWIALPVARAIGWVVASSVWLAVIERDWREYFSPVPRFALQLVVWLSAVLVGVMISDYFRMGRGELL